MKATQILWLILGIALMAPETLAAPEWNESLLNEMTPWTDEAGQALKLRDYLEKPVILSAFYTHCSRTCPELTFKKLREIEKQFNERKIDAQFVLVSIEPEQDTTGVLMKFKEKMAKGKQNWHFVRSETEAQTKSFVTHAGLGDYWKMDDHTLHEFKILYFDPSAKRVRNLDFKNKEVASLFE